MRSFFIYSDPSPCKKDGTPPQLFHLCTLLCISPSIIDPVEMRSSSYHRHRHRITPTVPCLEKREKRRNKHQRGRQRKTVNKNKLFNRLALRIVFLLHASSPQPSSSSAKKAHTHQNIIFWKKRTEKERRKWERESANVVVVIVRRKRLTCFVLPTMSASWWIVV